MLLGVSQFTVKVPDHPNKMGQVEYKSRALFELLNSISFSQCLIFCNQILRAEALCRKAEKQGKIIFYSLVSSVYNVILSSLL